MKYPRFVTPCLRAALEDTPVVLLNGPRQSGKSTLMQLMAKELGGVDYVTLDDATTLAAAQVDPMGFLSGFGGSLIIDEVQRAPGLFLAIKRNVDRDRRAGRYLLTGSANVLFLPQLADSLAGRMEVLPLYPLSVSELVGGSSTLVERLFQADLPIKSLCSGGAVHGGKSLEELLCMGGFPEVVGRSDPERRRRWFGSYLSTILQRDVRDLANIEGLTRLPDLLALLAARSANLLNYAELSRSLGLPQSTLKRYFILLQALFFIYPLSAWSDNLGKRLVKAPKIHLLDSGLLCHLLHLDVEGLRLDRPLFGHLLETFVVNECLKSLSWSKLDVSAFHYRNSAGTEVDLLLEGPNRRIVAIEVKASHSVTAADFKAIRELAEELGDRFVRGIVFYCGDRLVPFSEQLAAVPLFG